MDPVDALNRIFQDPADLDARLQESQRYAALCRDYVALQLAERPDPADACRQAEAAPQQLADLIGRSNEIQSVGRQTLDRVKEATHEIKRLDNTKENLTASIRMLRQLRMLSKLYGQLDALLKERRYEDMAGTIAAASDLIDYFRPFRPLPQIAQLSQEIGAMESKIYEQIEADFTRTVMATGSDAGGEAATPETLRAACVVLDSLDAASGKSASRDSLIKWYCDHMLAEYNRIFSPQDEAGSLENVTPRYTYLKRKVFDKHLSSNARYFTPSWSIQDELVKRIAERTSSDLTVQLSRLQSSESDHIQMLLTTIQESRGFESYTRSPPTISSQLLPYLSLWVEFQDRQLGTRISGYARTLAQPKEEDEVLQSSRELVNFYKALLSQLDKVQHGEKTVVQLADVMARNLGRYATRVLGAYLPPGGLRTKEDIALAGLVDATADYIIATIYQLERNMNAQLKNSELTDGIFEKQALSQYRQVAFKVEEMFVTFAQRSLEPHWIELAAQYNQLRGTNVDVSRVSPYMANVVEYVNSMLYEIFHAAVTPGVVYNVGSRITEVICVGFVTTAMARVTKPVSEPQAEQMLLDLGSIKTNALVTMLNNASEEVKNKKGATRLGRLNQRVLESVAQAEAILKVLMTPSEPMETFVRNYQLLVKDRATLNFRKILDVKGIRFQARAIEKFKMMATQEPNLDSENPLLIQIPTIAPPTPSAYENGNGSGSGFGINNFRRIGEFLRRDHQ